MAIPRVLLHPHCRWLWRPHRSQVLGKIRRLVLRHAYLRDSHHFGACVCACVIFTATKSHRAATFSQSLFHFACLFVFCFKVPFHDVDPDSVNVHVLNKRTPDMTLLPEESPLVLLASMFDCLNWEPSRRPSFAMLAQRLDTLESFLAQHLLDAQVVSPLSS